jgi:hypothetical protein
LNYTAGVALDAAGNMYIGDTFNNVVRKVGTNGVITTVAGNNNLGGGFSGDGGAATNAALNLPNRVAVDGAGNLYIADFGNNVVRKVDANGIITTVAGNNSLGGGYSGDGGAATNATLNNPVSVAVDHAGNLYIADYHNNVVRKVDARGVITTVAGNFSLGGGYSGDGGAATNAALSAPDAVALDGAGDLYFSEGYNHVVRRVGTNGIIATVAGNQRVGGGYSGDGGPATNAALNSPNGLVFDAAGDFYIAEYGNNVIRKVNASGTISTVAGNYYLGAGYSGDGGVATNATLNNPVDVTEDGAGNLYIGDAHNNVIRKVSTAALNVNSTNGTLTLTDVQGGTSGLYQVIVSNPAGSVTSSVVNLLVYGPPVITAEPASQTVNAGGSVTLAVGVAGTPPVKYQWTFNGSKIGGATNAALVLDNVTVFQAGNYAVKITTPAGAVNSATAQVTVISQNLLIYNISGNEKYVAGSQSIAYGYSGQLFFLPSGTNGTSVCWGVVGGQKRYWVGDFSCNTLYTIPGPGTQSSTVLAQAGQSTAGDGSVLLWSAVYQGQNSELNVGYRQFYSFPATFSGVLTQVYPDPISGNPVLDESSSTYTYAAQTTQAANNGGATITNLVNALTKSLAKQGYKN